VTGLSYGDRVMLEAAAHMFVKHGELELASRLRGLARTGWRRPRGDTEAIAAAVRSLGDGDLHTLFLSAQRAGSSALTARVLQLAERMLGRSE
jgi:hypothetical protein